MHRLARSYLSAAFGLRPVIRCAVREGQLWAGSDGAPRVFENRVRNSVVRQTLFNYYPDTLIGYARVSTDDQSLDLQRAALQRAGSTRIFEDKESSRSGTKRPALGAASDGNVRASNDAASGYDVEFESAVFL